MKYTTDSGVEWDVYDQLPEGWHIVSDCAPHMSGLVFIRPKDYLKAGAKSGRISLLREQPASPVQPKPVQQPEPVQPETLPVQQPPQPPTASTAPYPAKSVNDLARLKFKQKMLLEIQFDLMVCEVEGWDKRAYINELRRLLNSIDTSKPKPKTEQGGLF